jgi:hypothetical protein
MPKISIDHPSSIPADQAMSTIKNFFENDKDLQRIDSKIKCQFSPGELKGKVLGSQFKADIEVKAAGKGSEIRVVVDLPLILTPFKGKVEETLRKKLSQHLA